jgi:ubiquinone/menaquinone biosynthesis C-methylase UbiE
MSDVADFLAAKRVAPYGDDAVVASMTAGLAADGHRVLQIFRLGPDDRSHVSVLLAAFDPPRDALVLDAGCGIGAVSQIMREERPDLRFVLLNVSPAQLLMCDDDQPRIAADFHALPMADSVVDAVMFAYSLGHGLLDKAIAEAARVIRPGGTLFIYDLAGDDSGDLIRTLGYKAHAPSRVVSAAADAGLTCTLIRSPQASADDKFLRIIDRATFAWLFRSIVPMIYRFTK